MGKEEILKEINKNNVLKQIGKNLDYIRKEKNLSPSKFASLIKASKSQLTYVLRGEKGFSISKLLEISEITGYSIGFIYTGNKFTVQEEMKEYLELAKKQLELTQEHLKLVERTITAISSMINVDSNENMNDVV